MTDNARTDDVRGWLHEMSESDPDHGQAAMASRALGVIHDRGDEIDRLRTAGDELAAVMQRLGDTPIERENWNDAAHAIEAWRAARGDAPTDVRGRA